MTLDKDFIYFNGINFKSISGITDDQDDATVNLLGHSADSEIDTALAPFANSVPLVDRNLRTAESSALYYALSKWYAENSNAEKATFYDTQYTNEIEKLEAKLKSDNTGRTRRVARSLDYDTETLLHSQTVK